MKFSTSLSLWTFACTIAFTRAAASNHGDYAVSQWAAFYMIFFCVWVLPSWTLYQIWKRVIRDAFGAPTPVKPKRRRKIEPHLAGFTTIDAQTNK